MSLSDWLDCARDPANAAQAGLYFVGTFDRRITFYSQQVRALRLAHALDTAGLILPQHTTAVVGAGAAGVTAALALALLGHDVALYDPADTVLQLQSASERLLHPHIYEWPRVGSLDDQSGLPILDWSASGGAQVCGDLQASFSAAQLRLAAKLRFASSHQLSHVERDGDDWRLTFQHAGRPTHRVVQQVILAMGFGGERECGGVAPTDYWKQSTIGNNANEPLAPTSYLVSGNGDGALTELLRLLIANFEHVAFTRGFLRMFSGDALRRAASAVFNGTAIGQDVETALHAHLLPVLDEHGILDRLQPMLRHDRHVTVNSSGALYEAAKAAQLNQCMVYATLEAARRAAVLVVRSQGHMSGVEPVAGGNRAIGISTAGAPVTTIFRHVIARHGPDRDARYQPASLLYAAYQTYMQRLLAARPDLGEPPELASETFDRFISLAINTLYDPAVRPAMLAQLAQQQSTVVVGIDPAANVVVERGEAHLGDIAEQAERLVKQMTIQFDLPPARLAIAQDLVRLARASNGRIRLQALPVHHGAWQAFCGLISPATAAPSHYRSRELGRPPIARAIDASMGRLLDARLAQIVHSGACPTIGPIDAALLAQVAATWINWRTDLDSDQVLREHVFRLLAHVDPLEVRPWNGDHACLDDLASALIMMLATNHGQTLKLFAYDRGNLHFETDAIALGTGCRLIGGQPLADVWTEAQQWGVDALIISSSAEIEIALTPAGTVMNGGSIGKRIAQARHVRPAIIQNDSFWRKKLAGSLANWKAAVAEEFAAFRRRQDQQIDEVAR